jgi:DNA processing protein
MSDLHARGCAVLLAGLPKVGPRQLTELLADPGAEAAWAQLGGSSSVEPTAVLERHAAGGIEVLLPGDAAYPEALRVDRHRPAVLFASGDLAALSDVRVAIIGTRRCTGSGAGFARQLGRELTEAGVGIVSGLALGIDGAAHRGVLEANGRPIAVLGNGLDICYPARHRSLWEQVRASGVLLSEVPMGLRPAAWRFPARNRIIAALSHLVVVAESHAAGGSMLTVKEAIARDIQVMAVPGSVRSPSAAGSNQLIAEGCAPVLDSTDILVALGLSTAARAVSCEPPPQPSGRARKLLDAFDWEPVTLEHLAARTGWHLRDLALVLEDVIAGGWVTVDGGWYERTER